jgi:hypothetical protein
MYLNAPPSGGWGVKLSGPYKMRIPFPELLSGHILLDEAFDQVGFLE